MIGVIFYFGSELILVKVEGNKIEFAKDGIVSTIEGLRLNKTGVVKEFPDLENREDWRAEAIKRFKEKIKEFKTEKEKVDYIIKDLEKYGYVAKFIQRKGYRVEAIK